MNSTLLFSHDVENFCTPDSLDASVNYTNLLLTSYGYPVPIVTDSIDSENQCKTINCIYALINDRKRDMQERQQLLDEINRLNKSQEEVNNSLLNQKKENASQSKKIAELSSKIQQVEKDYKKQQIQNTRLKEEITKEKNNTQYVKTQYAHETKRHEQAMQKLQERLLKAMNSHMKTNVSSLDMNSHFATTLDYEADNDEVIQVRSMYADLLLKSTNRESLSKKESEELRIALIQLYAGVRRLIEDKTLLFERQRHSKKKNAYQETTRLNLPMDCGGKEALQEVNNLLARLREEWDYQLTKMPSEDLEEKLQEKENEIQSMENSMEELLQNMESTKLEYEEKMKVYQKYERGGFFDSVIPEPKPLEMSDSESSVVDIQFENVLKFKSTMKKMMKEQRKITEAAEELGKQRIQTQAERWAVEQMKYELQKREVLDEPAL